MDTLQKDFHLEEYKQIRGEVAILLTRVENLFRYSLIVTATIYAWLIVHSVGLTSESKVCLKLPASLLNPGWLIPPMFVFLASLIAFAAYWRINQMGSYLEMIENTIGISTLGWQKFLKTKKPVVTGTTIAIWVLLLAAASYGTLVGLRETQGKVQACKNESVKQG